MVSAREPRRNDQWFSGVCPELGQDAVCDTGECAATTLHCQLTNTFLIVP